MDLFADVAIVGVSAVALVLTVRIERSYWSRLLSDREREHRQDVRELLTRIQAPETAPYALLEPDDSPQHISEADEDRRFEEQFG